MTQSRRAFLSESAAALGAAVISRRFNLPAALSNTPQPIRISLNAFLPETFDYLYWRLWDPYLLPLGIPRINQNDPGEPLDLLLIGERSIDQSETETLTADLVQSGLEDDRPRTGHDNGVQSNILKQLATARGLIAVQPALLGEPLADSIAARCGVTFTGWNYETPTYSLATDHPLLVPLGQSVGSIVAPHVPYEWKLGVKAINEADVVTRFPTGEPDIISHKRSVFVSSNLFSDLYHFRRHADYNIYEASVTGTLVNLVRSALGAPPVSIPFPETYDEWRYHFYGYGYGRQFILKLMGQKGKSLSATVRQDVLRQLDHADTLIAEAAKSLLNGNIDAMQQTYRNAALELVACRKSITKVEPYFVRGWHGGLLSDQVVDGMLVGHAEWGWPSFTMRWAEDRIRTSEKLKFKQVNQVNGATWYQIEQHGMTDLAMWQKASADGILDSIKGMYSDAYLEVLGTESNIRQFEFGLQAFHAIGAKVRTFMVAGDDFAYHPQVPQIIRGFGFEYAMLRSGGPGKIKGIDHEVILWKGLDGSSVPSVPTYSSVPWPSINARPQAGINQMQKMMVAADTIGFKTVLGGGAVDAALEMYGEYEYEALNSVAPVQATQTNVAEYCQLVSQDPPPYFLGVDELQGEPWFWSGFGSINAICREDRRLERLLVAAEKFSVIAMQQGSTYPAAPLELAWRDLLSSQDHFAYGCGGPDNPEGYHVGGYMEPFIPDYPGPRTPITMEDTSLRWKARTESAAQSALDDAFSYLSNHEQKGAAAHSQQLLVFNPLNWERSDIVQAWIKPSGKASHLEVSDGHNVTPATIIAHRNGENGEEIQISFHAQSPSLGFRAYTVQEKKANQQVDPGQPTHLENQFLRVEVDPKTGGITSLFDKSTGKERLKPGTRTRFACSEPLINSDNDQVTVTVDRSDAILHRLQIAGHLGVCPYKMWLTLGHESPCLEVDLEVDYGKGAIFGFKGMFDSLLRIILPFAEGGSRWVNQPFGVYPTKGNHPVMLDFCDVSDGTSGMALMHDGVPGLHIDGSNVELLICDGNPPTRGIQKYRFALYPHAGDWRKAQVLQQAHEFQQPLIAHPLKTGGVTLPLERSYLNVPSDVILSALNVTDGQVRARFYDATGEARTVRTEWAFPLAKAWSAQLNGKVDEEISLTGNALQFELPAWKIFTLVGQHEKEAKA
jgi:alpha-mannosidase